MLKDTLSQNRFVARLALFSNKEHQTLRQTAKIKMLTSPLPGLNFLNLSFPFKIKKVGNSAEG
jgi:hypothetical protein